MLTARRTQETGLSDDALIICDFLWPNERRIPLTLLRKDIFPQIANISYTHSVSDASLPPFLDGLVSDGVLEQTQEIIALRATEAPALHKLFRLTPLGGRLWERERLPDWSSFVNIDVSDGEDMEILSLSDSLPLKYISAMVAAGLWRVSGEVSHRILRPAALVPWRVFEQVHSFQVAVDRDFEPREYNWEVYEHQRVWWSSTKELLG